MLQILKWLNRIIYQNDVEMISSPAKKDMDHFIIQSMFGNVFGIVTGGSFLMGYLIYLGAADEIISYVPIIPSVCGILVVFCSNLVEKYERRRRLVLVLNLLSKFTLISIVLIPLFVSKIIAIPIVYFLLVAGYSFNMINALVVNTLFIEVIPIKIRGRYVSTRQILTVLVSIVLPVVAGKIVDSFDDKYYAFLILYGFAVIAATCETITFSKISNPVIKNIKKPLRIKELFSIPMKNKEFMRFTISIALFQFFFNMSMSFSTVYALKYINVSYTYLNAVSIINFVLQVFITYKFWGIANDRISSNFVSVNCMWFFILDALMWFFISPKTIYFILPIAHVFGSINASGFTVGTFSRRFQLIPEEGRLIYDSFYVGFIGFALFLSPLAGNLIRDYAAKISFVNNFQFGNFRVAYMLTVICLLLLQASNFIHIKKHEPSNECLNPESYKRAFSIFKEITYIFNRK